MTRRSSRPSLPARSADDGSHARTDSSRSGSPSAMYGGLLTMTSTAPRSEPSSAPYQLPWAKRAPIAALPAPAAFARATSSASADASVIHTVAWPGGSSSSTARPIAPDPVPRSTTVAPGPAPRTAAVTMSTTSSVSGRGMSTRASTIRSRRRKPHRPSTYCSGSPARRRRSIDSICLPARSGTHSPAAARSSAASKPPAVSQTQRASFRSPSSAATCAVISAHVMFPSSRLPVLPTGQPPSASCLARRSAASASTTGSRSPASAACNWYSVNPMRWSVIRFSL